MCLLIRVAEPEPEAEPPEPDNFAGAGAAGTILPEPEPEPPGQFFQIRSRSRSRRNFYNMDPAPVAKPTQIMGKSNLFLQKYIEFINIQTKPNLSKHMCEVRRI